MSRLKKISSAILLVMTIVSACAMVLSAYIGFMSPATHSLAGLLPLTFPVWIALTLVAAITGIFICRKATIIAAFAIIVSAGPLLDYCPLNFFHGNADNREDRIKLLTYNAYHFNSILPGEPYPGGVNPTLSYIIGSQADIVAVQESHILKPDNNICITQEQIDSLTGIYPYIIQDTQADGMLLSKYPLKRHDIPKNTSLRHFVLCADVFIGDDTLKLYSVHMRSFQLSDDDKRLYHDIAKLEGSRDELKEAKSVLLSKLTTANADRAIQADTLLEIINSRPTDNIIVCGDFNDVASSYTIRTLCRANGGLGQAYAKAGLGPMVTYNRRSFPFRIDHVLYSGAIEPIEVYHGDIKSSDHYPLVAVFRKTK